MDKVNEPPHFGQIGVFILNFSIRMSFLVLFFKRIENTALRSHYSTPSKNFLYVQYFQWVRSFSLLVHFFPCYTTHLEKTC